MWYGVGLLQTFCNMLEFKHWSWARLTLQTRCWERRRLCFVARSYHWETRPLPFLSLSSTFLLGLVWGFHKLNLRKDWTSLYWLSSNSQSPRSFFTRQSCGKEGLSHAQYKEPKIAFPFPEISKPQAFSTSGHPPGSSVPLKACFQVAISVRMFPISKATEELWQWISGSWSEEDVYQSTEARSSAQNILA